MLISIFKTFSRILYTLIKAKSMMNFSWNFDIRIIWEHFFFAYHCHGILFGDKRKNIGEQNDSFKVEGAQKKEHIPFITSCVCYFYKIIYIQFDSSKFLK